MNAEIPQEIKDRLTELNEIVKQYPRSIPLNVCAKFLGMKPNSLREYLEYASYPFGMAWRQKSAVNRAFKIPTLTFYLYATHSGILTVKEV